MPGPIQEPDSYGQAKVFGGSGQAGVDIVLGNRFAIRLVGEFTQVGFSFTGNGVLVEQPRSRSDDQGRRRRRRIARSAAPLTLAVLY